MNLTKEIFDLSVVSQGNKARLAKLMEKAAKGENLTLAVIGGSITAGSSSSVQDKCYASLTAKWWRDNFPQANFTFHNMGIGATTSVLGVHRLENDILAKKPDFLIVEFAVNDDDTMYPYYENLIRRVMLEEKETAVIMLFMTTESGWNRQEQQIAIGEAYGLPMISYHNVIRKLIDTNEITWRDVSPDDVHPNDEGHSVCASLLASYLDGVKAEYANLCKCVPAVPEKALYGERYMNAKLYTASTLEADSNVDWVVDSGMNFYHLNTGWKTENAGAELTFETEFKEVNICYRKMISDPEIGNAKVFVDGNEVDLLEGAFPGGWGDYFSVKTSFKADEITKHTLTIESTGKFYILAILLS